MKYSLILACVCPFFWSPMFAQPSKEAQLTKSTVNKATIEGHTYFIASDELRGRDTGSPEIDIAAKYLATTFRGYGVKPVNDKGDYFQQVKLEQRSAPSTLFVSFDGQSVGRSTQIAMVGLQNVALQGKGRYFASGNLDKAKKKKIEGHTLYFTRKIKGMGEVSQMFGEIETRKAEALKLGAVAVVEVVSMQEILWARLSRYLNNSKLALAQETKEIPYILVADDEGNYQKALSELGKKTFDTKIDISGVKNNVVLGKNVVGMVEGTDPELKEEFVVYSAHYDHIGVGLADAQGDSINNGARDNAVGVVTVLSAAQNIAMYPTKRSALFVLFTAEEKGLLGSKWFVEHAPVPLEKIVYCFNSDNGGYNDTSIASIVGLVRTEAQPLIEQACEAFGLKATDEPDAKNSLFDRSDNVNFAAKGIPAPTFSLGFTAFDEEILKYYHKQADNPDNLDYDYLEKFFRAYVMACRLIANADKAPFWVAGDKYFEKGKALYGAP